MTDAFLDSNILVYVFENDGRRSPIARDLLAARPLIGVQCLNEFANVARRKLGFSWPEVSEALAAIEILVAGIQPLSVDTHRVGLALSERYGLTIHDGQLVAVALAAGCRTFFSEDMHHGLVIDERLTITNPFRA